MKYFTKEVRIALVAIVGLIILYVGMNFLKGISLFSNSRTYYIRFANIEGLSSSNPVFADGYQVGTVRDISYDYSGRGGAVVRVDLDRELRIPLGSAAEIQSDIMGNVKLNLLLANNPRERVSPGDTISGDVAKGIAGVAAQMVPQLQRTLNKVDSLLDNVNKLLANPDIAQTLANMRTVSGDLTTSTRELNTLLATTNRTLPTLAGKANNVMDNADKLTANLAAVDVQATMQQVNQTLANVQQFTHKLNSNEGTLGLMLNDPSLYNRMTATMSSADSLLVDLKAHPKRYVHFSIFGRKDK